VLVAWTLNLRGRDVPFNPVFHAYLFIALDRTVLFIETAKVTDEIQVYLNELNITTMEYSEVWSYLRQWKWGDGKVDLIHPLRRICFDAQYRY
jgi:Xaa-Pro aminopeptidase